MPSPNARPRLVAALAAAALAAVAGACEFDKSLIDEGRDRLVVHSVLNPGRPDQIVLVERMLAGRVDIPSSEVFEPEDPLTTGGGEPVSGARVVIYGPTGDSVIALEDRTTRPDGRGAGVYRFFNFDPCGVEPAFAGRCLAILPGERYRLRVEAPTGTVTGATTVPSVPPAPALGTTEFYNRDRDSIFIFWGEVPFAKRYALRIDSPRGPFQLFLDSLEYLVSGALRNPFDVTVPSVFMPGFRQSISIAAVDTNYFDYYRSANNPFTGSGLINHLDGGLGVFGSYVLLRHKTVTVTATLDEPIEGTYRRQSALGIAPRSFLLYVEGRVGGAELLTGNYTAEGSFEPRGLVGRLVGSKVTLVFLKDQLASDTVAVFDGEFDDFTRTMTGTIRGSGQRDAYAKVQ